MERMILLMLCSAVIGALSQCSHPYCDPSKPSEERIQNLLSLATLSEKAGLLMGKGIERLQVPSLTTGEALHGVVGSCGHDKTGRQFCPSSFPSALGLSASRNETLWNMIGQQISTESRALVPVGGARWTPDINLFRDPRWGRGQEVPGEDPHLTSRYAVNFVRGLQEGEDPRYHKVIATCKHFFAYDIDAGVSNNKSYDRHSFNAVVPKADLVDYYLPAWEACVVEAKAASIMCSYNAVNGTPSCANSAMQNGLLRDKWGWGKSQAPANTPDPNPHQHPHLTHTLVEGQWHYANERIGPLALHCERLPRDRGHGPSLQLLLWAQYLHSSRSWLCEGRP